LDLAGETPLIIRHLIAPLTIAAVSLYAGQAGAQGAFPAPLPGQTAAPAASPFPPVNGAPAATIAAPPASSSAFSTGAAPIGGAGGFGSGPPPSQASGPPDACMKNFIPLRQETEKRGKLLEAAGKKKGASPDEICKLLTGYSQAEFKMMKYVESNGSKCGIPPQIGDQLKTSHTKTAEMQQRVCGVAQQAAQARAAATPSLSEVLGSSAALPEATPQKKGGSTFDTLNGNVLTR
jgi:hypothetical protein